MVSISFSHSNQLNLALTVRTEMTRAKERSYRNLKAYFIQELDCLLKEISSDDFDTRNVTSPEIDLV